MWSADLKQVYARNVDDNPFDAWVLFLRLGADTSQEAEIRGKHEAVDSTLADQNVLYTEITTQRGKNEVFRLFCVRDRAHPLFLILNKPPLEHKKGDHFIVIEWGKWKDIDELRTDLMKLANFFSEKDFVTKLAEAKDVTTWERVMEFSKTQGISALSLAVTVASM